MVGDMAKVSIGTMIYGGKTVGVSSHVSGLVDRDVSDFTSYDGRSEESFLLTLRSVNETLSRMMERRGKSLTPRRKAFVEHLYKDAVARARAQGARRWQDSVHEQLKWRVLESRGSKNEPWHDGR